MDPDECTNLFIEISSSILPQKMHLLKESKLRKLHSQIGSILIFCKQLKREINITKKQNVQYYKLLRNRVKELVYKATYDYFNEHLNSHKQNPKLLWRSVCVYQV